MFVGGDKRDKYDPIKTMFKGVMSSISPSSSGAANAKAVDLSHLNLEGSVWPSVIESLRAGQTPSELSFRSSVSSGTVSSPMSRMRLFGDDKEEDVRVVFYRDSASWCPYCQKVWVLLEAANISYRVEKVNMRCYGDKPQSFLRLQPSGNIPVAVVDGQVLGQSNDIIYTLISKLAPQMGLKDAEAERGTRLLRLEREVRGPVFIAFPFPLFLPYRTACTTLTLPLHRQLFGKWMYYLTGSRDSARYRSEFLSCLSSVDSELLQSSGGFFVGGRPTVVDFMFAPFLERMAASMAYFKGLDLRSGEVRV